MGREPLRDGPVVWYDRDDADIPEPAERDPDFIVSSARAALWRPLDRFFHPGRFARRVGSWLGGQRVPPAADLNALDEVPNSTWFTNRIGLGLIDPQAVARGPGGNGPDRSAPWQVIGAKVDGVTPGFQIRDARGDVYLIKFDPPGHPGMTIRAGVVANRLFHACGYNVPEDHVVVFRRRDLVLGPDARFRPPGGGRERLLTPTNLDSLLGEPMRETGEWCALASRYLEGTPLGPFSYCGRRGDDPNDRIDHQDRRVLRGLKVLCAWLNHFDTKEQNSLDMYVTEDGRSFVRHYLIDFASTLGAGGRAPNPKLGYEYGFDLPAVSGKLLALGIHDDRWAHLERPAGLVEVGYLDNRLFDPAEWKPYQPNSAFADLTPRDGYWAAKILSGFTSAHIEAAVHAAGYHDPRATDYVVRALEERRDRLVRHWFDRVPPLDFFAFTGDAVDFRDLGVEGGHYPEGSARYRARWAAVTADRDAAAWTGWQDLTGPRAPLAAVRERLDAASPREYPFLALAVQVDRGDGWSPTTTVYVTRGSGRVVALDR